MTRVQRHGSGGGGRRNGFANEESPLLGGSSPKPRRARWHKSLMDDVSYSWTDAVLLACYMVTGLLDSSSIQVWGTFVSMQTGNTIYVGLGLASLLTTTPSSRLIKSAVSLSSFCIGSFFFARFHRFFSVRRRWVLCVSFTAQMLCTVAAALIVSRDPPAEDDGLLAWNVLVPIALVAFQSCGQAVTSRALRHDAFTSVVLTSIYTDLFSDQELFALHNVPRNRRVAAPLLLLMGTVLGGLLSVSSFGIAGALWLAAWLKLLMVVTWFFWAAESECESLSEAYEN
ncbi:hypothetical protein QQX98_009972 [Neonectria punicea]|uniref:DUF1275 domain protein n=1 Tax=Neonectria punicea TaxID=979145 RepID=A0ABR1GQR0_9HYPO